MKLLRALLAGLLLLPALGHAAGSYSFVGAGTVDYDQNASNALTPTAHASCAAGNLMVMPTWQRQGSQTITTPTGWTVLGTENAGSTSGYVLARVKTGTADDAPTVQWTGTTADVLAWIDCFSGDEYTDLSTIVAHSDLTAPEGNETFNLRLPGLTITTDNTMVYAVAMRYRTTTADTGLTGITAPAGLTETREHLATGLGNSIMAAAAWAQQTTATNYSGDDFTRDGGSENVVTNGFVFSLKTQAAPAFDTSPAVASQTASAYTISYNANADAANFFAGAYKAGSSTPTCDNIEAGTGTGFVDNDSEASTGASDSLVLSITGTPFPKYDIHACLEGPGGDSSVVSLANEFLDPATGKEFTVVDVPCGGGVESILDGASPAIVDGDIIVSDTHVDSFDEGDDQYELTMSACGSPSVNPGEDESRLDFEAVVYDVSVGDYSDTYDGPTFYINDRAPEFIGNPEDLDFLFEEDVAITAVPLVDRWDDAEGDEITVTYEDSLPTGLSLVSEELTGTPTTCETVSVTERATSDLTGEFDEEEVTIAIGHDIPDVEGDDEATAVAAIEALCSWDAVAGLTAPSDTIPAGSVVSTTPDIGTLTEYDATITYHLSSGDQDWTVPDCHNLTVTQCEEAVLDSAPWRADFLDVSVDEYVCGSGEEFLHVAEQTPAADEEVDPFEPMTINIVGAVMPDLSGMTAAEAVAAIEAICP